jgi:hypothetical protein
MKLTSAQVQKALTQYQGQPIPEITGWFRRSTSGSAITLSFSTVMD